MRTLQSVLAVSCQYVLIYLLLGLTTAFTSARSCLRYISIVIILVLALSIQISAFQTPNVPPPIRGILAMGAWIQVFNGFDILFHSRINYSEHIVWKKENELIVRGGAIWFALCIPHNFRRLDTKWQSAAIQRLNKKTRQPTPKKKFIKDRFRSILLICSTALLLFFISSHLEWIPIQREIFPLLDQSGLLTGLSWECLPALIHLHLFFVITMFLFLKVIYAFLSIAAVSLYLSSPTDWPSFYSSPWEAKSTRKFWGMFWHQTLRSLLTSNADFIISKTPLRPNTITWRFARYFICFFISGLIHLSLELAIGISMRNTGAMVFLPVQSIAFAVEDAAVYLSNRYGILTKDTIGKRIIGYFWVWAFSFWSWRPWAYPVLMRSLEVGEPITTTYFHVRGPYTSTWV